MNQIDKNILLQKINVLFETDFTEFPESISGEDLKIISNLVEDYYKIILNIMSHSFEFKKPKIFSSEYRVLAKDNFTGLINFENSFLGSYEECKLFAENKSKQFKNWINQKEQILKSIKELFN